MKTRKASVERITKETQIRGSLTIDGQGTYQIATGMGPRLFAGIRGDPADAVRGGQLIGEFHAVFPLVLEVPPLRDRRTDLEQLVGRLIERANEEGGNTITGLHSQVWEIINQHAWPGNVRELFEVLASARRHARGPIVQLSDLPASLLQRAAPSFPKSISDA